MIYIILAALLLFGAMFNLYYVETNTKRLGFIAGHTIVFALCVGFLTNARRAGIFGACAAYAAVLGVFISGGLGGRNTRQMMAPTDHSKRSIAILVPRPLGGICPCSNFNPFFLLTWAPVERHGLGS